MPAEKINLDDLLPHRGAMRLVDEVVAVDSEHAVTRARVALHWPGLGPTGLSPEVLIELMAQTAGVHNGWVRLNDEGPEGDTRGWLVGIKSARLGTAPIPVGATLVTRAENTYAFDNFREVSGSVTLDGEELARAVMQLLRAA